MSAIGSSDVIMCFQMKMVAKISFFGFNATYCNQMRLYENYLTNLRLSIVSYLFKIDSKFSNLQSLRPMCKIFVCIANSCVIRFWTVWNPVIASVSRFHRVSRNHVLNPAVFPKVRVT